MRTNGLISLLFALIVSGNAFGQISQVGKLIEGGVNDANLLIEEYLTPLGFGFGANLNNGWYSTAKTHRFLGFDLMVSAHGAFAPEEAEFYDINALELENVRVKAGSEPEVPTIIGKEVDTPSFVEITSQNPFTGERTAVDEFELPNGVDLPMVPSVMIQASVGIISNTDLIFRFFPETAVGDDIGKAKMYGFGLKHNLSHLFAGSVVPVDLAAMFGYTSFQAQAEVDEQRHDSSLPGFSGEYDDQEIEVEASAWTANLLISKKLAILTFFGSLGIERSTVDLKVKGNFPVKVIEDDVTSPNYGNEVIRDIEDPVDLTFESPNSLRATVGMSLSLTILAIHASYTMAEYPVLTVGAGISVF